MATGEVKRMPRLFGVQAENCAPFPRGAERHFVPGEADRRRRHRIAKTVRTKAVLAAIAGSGGAVGGAPESEIARSAARVRPARLFRRADLGNGRRRALAPLRRRARRARRDDDRHPHRHGLKAAPVVGDLLGIE